MKKQIKRFGYMDKIDFDYELGEASDGSRIFPDIACLKRAYDSHINHCGIVKVEVRFVRLIRKGKK